MQSVHFQERTVSRRVTNDTLLESLNTGEWIRIYYVWNRSFAELSIFKNQTFFVYFWTYFYISK